MHRPAEPRGQRDLPPRVVTCVPDAPRRLRSANDDCYGLFGPTPRQSVRPGIGDLKYMPDMLATLEYQV